MKKIKIILTKPKNHLIPIISWLIMAVEGTKYSHVVINWYVESLERELYYEAVGSGVNFLSWKLFPEKYYVIEQYEFEVESLKKIAQFCHDTAQTKYGKLSIVGLAWMRFLKLFGIKTSNPFRDGTHSQVCLETGLLVLLEAKAISKLPDDVDNYGLVEFHEVLDQYGKKLTA